MNLYSNPISSVFNTNEILTEILKNLSINNLEINNFDNESIKLIAKNLIITSLVCRLFKSKLESDLTKLQKKFQENKKKKFNWKTI